MNFSASKPSYFFYFPLYTVNNKKQSKRNTAHKQRRNKAFSTNTHLPEKMSSIHNCHAAKNKYH